RFERETGYRSGPLGTIEFKVSDVVDMTRLPLIYAPAHGAVAVAASGSPTAPSRPTRAPRPYRRRTDRRP
ncbi:MAG: hypothetical protein ACJ8E1_01990, partial [Xanthobacteraceae bacterium]